MADVITSLKIEQDASVQATIKRLQEMDKQVESINQSSIAAAKSMSAIAVPAISQAPQAIAPSGVNIKSEQTAKKIQETAANVDVGKLQSGLTGLSGAVNMLGGESAATTTLVLNTASALPGMAKSLTDLKGGAAAVPGQLAGVASSVTAMGVAAIPVVVVVGAIAVALGAFAIAAHDAGKEEAARAKEIERTRKAQESYYDALSKTSSEIEEEINLNKEKLRQIQEQKKAEEDLIAANKSDNIFEKVGDALGVTGQVADQATDRLKELSEQEKQLTEDTKALTEAQKSAQVAANDARKSLLENVDQIGELRRFEKDALNSSAEENAKRAEEIASEKAIIQEQIAALRASGDTSKEVQDEIKKLTKEMDTLDKQSAILSSSAVKAAEAQKTLADAQKRTAELSKEVASAQSAYREAQDKASKESFEAAAKVAEEEAKARADYAAVVKDAGNARMELIRKQQQEIIDAEREKQRALADITRKGQREARRQAEDMDFLGAFDTERRMADELEDAAIAADEKLSMQREADIIELQEITRANAEKIAIAHAGMRAQVEASANEWLMKEMQAQDELEKLRVNAEQKQAALQQAQQQEQALQQKAANERQKSIQQSEQQIVAMAQRTAQSVTAIASSAVQSLTTLQQSAVSNAQSIMNISSQIGTIQNNFNGIGSQAAPGINASQVQSIVKQMLQGVI